MGITINDPVAIDGKTITTDTNGNIQANSVLFSDTVSANTTTYQMTGIGGYKHYIITFSLLPYGNQNVGFTLNESSDIAHYRGSADSNSVVYMGGANSGIAYFAKTWSSPADGRVQALIELFECPDGTTRFTASAIAKDVITIDSSSNIVFCEGVIDLDIDDLESIEITGVTDGIRSGSQIQVRGYL
jgi:hypothetical protein